MAKHEPLEVLAQKLANATGITVAQAKDIIRLVGTDWSSLVREARVLKAKR